MVDEDFVMGYAVGYNDGVGSGGGSGGGLDSYPVFKNKKFRVGGSDFYFMVGDINTGFYDIAATIDYDKASGAYKRGYMRYHRYLCVFLYRGSECFGLFRTNADRPFKRITPAHTTTYHITDASFEKITPSDVTGGWSYNMNCIGYYYTAFTDGNTHVETDTFSEAIYSGLYFNDDGTINSAPSGFSWAGNGLICLNNDYFAELMDLMLTLPDINEEV